MPAFSYKALDRDGRFVSGELEADSIADTRQRLEQMGYKPLETLPRKGSGGARAGLSLWRRPLSQRDVTILLRELALVLRAGLPLADAIELLAGEEAGSRAAVLRDVGRAIGSGASFPDALARHPEQFGSELVAIVRVADTAGNLETVLEAVAEDRIRSEQLLDKITSALRYPFLLLIGSIGVLIFLLVVVIPQFAGVIRDFGGAKDDLTRLVLGASDVVNAHGATLAAAALATLLAGLLIWRNANGRSVILRTLSRLPGIRGLVEMRRTILFCGNLSMLLRNGVTLSEALRVLSELPAGASGGLEQVSASVRRGGRLADALAKFGHLPPLATRMLGVGEEVGALDTVARRTADLYDAKLSQRLDRLSGIVGPVALLLIALVIGTLVVTLLSALLNINQSVL